MHHQHHALTLVARYDDRPELSPYLFTLVFFEVDRHETVVVAQAETFDASLNSQGSARSKSMRRWSITFVEAVRGSNAHSLTQPLSSNPIVMITSVVEEKRVTSGLLSQERTWSVVLLEDEKCRYPVGIDMRRCQRVSQFQRAHIVDENLRIASAADEKVLVGQLVIEGLDEW